MNKYCFLPLRTIYKYCATTDDTINRICTIKNKKALYIIQLKNCRENNMQNDNK